MREIPDFLRRENRKPIGKEEQEMMVLQEDYMKKFGTYPMTEPSTYTTQEWIDILNECIEKNITIWRCV